MSSSDKERWNKKYQNSLVPQNVLSVVEQYLDEVKGKKALDIACGMGRHSKYLAQKGFEVDALDISEVAIEQLQNIENINAQIVDFDTYRLKENSYDLIVCTYFLERKLFPQIELALKEGGIVIFETFVHDDKNTKVPSNRSFLLEKGELEGSFGDRLSIIYKNEFMDINQCGDKSMKISMVAKKKR